MSKLQDVLGDRRILLLIAVVAASIILIGPTVGDDGLDTNLRYGLELEGGVWMQLQVNGATVTGSADAAQALQDQVSTTLDREVSITEQDGIYLLTFDNVTDRDVEALQSLGNATRSDGGIRLAASQSQIISDYLSSRFGAEVIPFTGTQGTSYEIRTDVSRGEAEAAFQDVGGSLSDYEQGVSDRTLETTQEVIEKKVNRLGLRDISVRTAGSNYVLVDMAGNITLDRAREIVSEPGQFELRVETEETGGVNESIHALWGDEIISVTFPNQDDNEQWGVPFTLSERGGEQLQTAVLEAGAAEPGSNKNIIMLLDGDVVYSAPIAEDLKQDFRESEAPVRSIRANTGRDEEGRESAQNLEIHLKAGALPVDVSVGASGEISPTLGESFKTMTLVAGILALLAVSIVTFVRYRRPVITITILLVAFSEVLILLGISSRLQDLTLPALAGIIITIGTGIDHLIVISDEVLKKGRVPTSRTFAKRLSRANWIIYAAAFTTIIAMMPLYFMGLGRLSGFAILTILGVLAGILVTRPAYGRLIYVLMRGNGKD